MTLQQNTITGSTSPTVGTSYDYVIEIENLGTETKPQEAIQ
jgi:hypothetical protein